MATRKARDLAAIITRSRHLAAVIHPQPISAQVLERLLEEAWTAGGSAMADSITQRDCDRELDALRAAALCNDGGAA